MNAEKLPNIDIERIKAYNNSLKEYSEKGARLEAEAEFTEKELNKICQELSAELGIEVNKENIEQVYRQRIEALENTLKVGEEIIQRIKNEENRQGEIGSAKPVQYNTQQEKPTYNYVNQGVAQQAVAHQEDTQQLEQPVINKLGAVQQGVNNQYNMGQGVAGGQLTPFFAANQQKYGAQGGANIVDIEGNNQNFETLPNSYNINI